MKIDATTITSDLKRRFPSAHRLPLKRVRALFDDDSVTDSFALEILIPIGEFHMRDLEKLARVMDGLSVWASERENWITLVRYTIPEMKRKRRRFRSARTYLMRCLRSLSDTENVLAIHRSEMKEHVRTMHTIRKSLLQVESKLRRAESDLAAQIPLEYRSAIEKNVAEWSHVKPIPIPKNVRSAATKHEVVRLLEQGLVEFTKGGVASSHLDRFISRYLTSIGIGTTDQNVKMIRRRLRKTLTKAAEVQKLENGTK